MDAPRPVAERALRHEAWLAALQAQPYRFDFYQAMRRFASAHPELPPLGEALRPVDEPLRVAQPAELDFAPAPLHALVRRDGFPPRLMQRIFGLLGPNGALPLHLTEYARERANHHGDPTFQRFLDTFTHRFALLFYRAWAEAQPAVSLDRRGNKAYFNRLGSLVGIGLPSLQDRDELSDASKVYFAGRLARQTRDAEGLLSWVRSEFDVPVAIQQWCGHWMTLLRGERSRLGRREGAQLGRSAVLGGSVWDVQHKFRITIGPLTLAEYRRFLPGGPDLARLQALVRHWVGVEFAWDLKLILAHAEVPRLELAAAAAPEPAPTAPPAEGQHEVELVGASLAEGAHGRRIALRLRIAAGSAAGAEFVESVPPRPARLGRIDELLRALDGVPSGPATAAGGPATAESTAAAQAAAPAARDDRYAALGDDPFAALGDDRTEPDSAAGAAAAAPAAAATEAGAAAGAAADTEADAAAAGDAAAAAASALRAAGATADDAAALLQRAQSLIGRRCRVAVRLQRSTDGTARAMIGARTGLGHTTWLGRYLRRQDADDLRLDVERPCAET